MKFSEHTGVANYWLFSILTFFHETSAKSKLEKWDNCSNSETNNVKFTFTIAPFLKNLF